MYPEGYYQLIENRPFLYIVKFFPKMLDSFFSEIYCWEEYVWDPLVSQKFHDCAVIKEKADQEMPQGPRVALFASLSL